jgi:hypothetical protein
MSVDVLLHSLVAGCPDENFLAEMSYDSILIHRSEIKPADLSMLCVFVNYCNTDTLFSHLFNLAFSHYATLATSYHPLEGVLKPLSILKQT